MAETVQSIIDFLTSRVSDTLLNDAQQAALVSELKGKINLLSVEVPNAAPDAITLVYSGYMPNGVHTGEVAELLVAANSPGKVLTLNQTQVYELLANKDFSNALYKALGENEEALKYILDGKDLSGKRIAFDSLWDDASSRFAHNAKGDVRAIIGLDADVNGVFAKTELKAFLENTKVTSIEGIPVNDLKAVSLSADQFDSVKTTSTFHAAHSLEVKVIHLDGMRVVDVDGVNKFLHEVTDPDFEKYVQKYPHAPVQANAYYNAAGQSAKDELKAMTKMMVAEGDNALNHTSVGSKVLNKLGWVGDLLSFGLAANEAEAAYAAGNPEQAKEIMKLWAVDTAGSAAGAWVAGTLGVIALGALGVTSAPLVGALALGAALVGGIFGGEGAVGLYNMTKDMDENGRMDLVDKLCNLLFGIDHVITSPLPADLNGDQLTLNTGFSRDEIVANAMTDIAWRYALRELNPFVIPDISYDRHNQDGSLDLYDPETGKGAMTERYLQDRAAMLTWKLAYDTGQLDDDDSPHDGIKSYNRDWDTNAIQGNWDFVDLSLKLLGGAPLTISIDGKGLSLSDHQVVFGSKGADLIEGSGVEDFLYGGSGDDTLVGGRGSDYLEGGLGNDAYVFSSGILGIGGDGHDTILDVDGKGRIEIDGVTLGSFSYYYQYWRSNDDKSIKAHFNPAGDLVISYTGGKITVLCWQEGDLGILDVARNNPQNNYDTDPVDVELSLNNYHKFSFSGYSADSSVRTGRLEDYIQGINNDELIYAGDGNDLVMGGLGNDTIYGEGGNDYLMGGPLFGSGDDDDVLIGGDGRDMLLGGLGDDIIHSGNIGDHLLPHGAGSEASGDWVAGGDGDDIIYGSNARDFLQGGGGADFIIAGAGNNVILGDGDIRQQLRLVQMNANTYIWTYTNTGQLSYVTYQYQDHMAITIFDWTMGYNTTTNGGIDFTDFQLTLGYGQAYGSTTRAVANGGDDTIFGGDGNCHAEASNGNIYKIAA